MIKRKNKKNKKKHVSIRRRQDKKREGCLDSTVGHLVTGGGAFLQCRAKFIFKIIAYDYASVKNKLNADFQCQSDWWKNTTA